MTEPVAVRVGRSDTAPPLGGAAPPSRPATGVPSGQPGTATPSGQPGTATPSGQPGTAAPDAPGRRPGSVPGSRAVAGRFGGACPGLVGIRYLLAVALLVALVWIPALIMIVAAHRSLPH